MVLTRETSYKQHGHDQVDQLFVTRYTNMVIFACCLFFYYYFFYFARKF